MDGIKERLKTQIIEALASINMLAGFIRSRCPA